MRDAAITVSDKAEHYDGIILRSYSLHNHVFPAALRAIARAGAGTNNIPIEQCSQSGIVVFNTPGANANSVKELVIAGLLLSSRNIFESMLWTQSLAGRSDEIPDLIEAEKKHFVGPEIRGKVLGVIGLGAVGSLVANTATDLGMRVLGYDPYISVDTAWHITNTVRRETSLESLIAQSDYISVHIPFFEQTRHFIGASLLKHAKKNLVLLNFSRDGIVDTQAVIEALEQKRIARYVTDFPEDDLLGMPHVLAIPHLGASTPEAEENAALMAAETLTAFLLEGTVRHSVNFPPCSLEWQGQHRLTIGNKNIPSMVSTITAIIARYDLNIEDMINKHHNDVAYNIIDIDVAAPAELIEELEDQEGILCARYLHRARPANN